MVISVGVRSTGPLARSLPSVKLSACRRWWHWQVAGAPPDLGSQMVFVSLDLETTYSVLVAGSMTGVPTIPTSGLISAIPVSLTPLSQVSPLPSSDFDHKVTQG